MFTWGTSLLPAQCNTLFADLHTGFLLTLQLTVSCKGSVKFYVHWVHYRMFSTVRKYSYWKRECTKIGSNWNICRSCRVLGGKALTPSAVLSEQENTRGPQRGSGSTLGKLNESFISKSTAETDILCAFKAFTTVLKHQWGLYTVALSKATCPLFSYLVVNNVM